MPDIPDATFVELGRLLHKVAHDPKGRRKLFDAIKEVEPERYQAQADIVMEDRLNDLETRLEAKDIERKAGERRAALEASRKALSSRYAEEDITKIEKLMEEIGIDDYERGARLYAAEVKPVTPRNGTPRPSAKWTLPTFDGLVKDPKGAALDMAYSVIDEIRAGRPA